MSDQSEFLSLLGYKSFNAFDTEMTPDDVLERVELSHSSRLDAFVNLQERHARASGIKNSDISRLRWIFLDFDSEPKGIEPKTLPELEVIRKKVTRKMQKRFGVRPSYLGFSGRGFHVLYRIDWPVDEEPVLVAFLKFLNAIWPYVDPSTGNRTRLIRIPGSVNSKCGKTAKLLYIDHEQEPIPLDKVVRLIGKQSPAPAPMPEQESIAAEVADKRIQSLVNTLTEFGVYKRHEAVDNGYRIEVVCDRDHSSTNNGKTNIFINADGTQAFHCHSSRCQGRTVDDYLAELSKKICDKPHEHLFESFLPRGTVSQIYGNTGTSKTGLAAYIAGCVINGRDFLDRECLANGHVIWVSSEIHEDPNRLMFMIKQSGCDESDVDIISNVIDTKSFKVKRISLYTLATNVESRIRDNTRLIVVDTLTSLVETTTAIRHPDVVMDVLYEIAKEHDVNVLFINHLSKESMHRGQIGNSRGSTIFTNQSANNIAVVKAPSDDSENPLFQFADARSRLSGEFHVTPMKFGTGTALPVKKVSATELTMDVTDLSVAQNKLNKHGMAASSKKKRWERALDSLLKVFGTEQKMPFPEASKRLAESGEFSTQDAARVALNELFGKHKGGGQFRIVVEHGTYRIIVKIMRTQ